LLQAPLGPKAFAYLAVTQDSGSYLRIIVQNGQLYFQQKIAGQALAILAQTPYDLAVHKWWRIRHDAMQNQITFETSSTGSTWASSALVAAPVWINAAFVELQGGTVDPEPLSASKFSDFQLE
jgi:hypothetical protein